MSEITLTCVEWVMARRGVEVGVTWHLQNLFACHKSRDFNFGPPPPGPSNIGGKAWGLMAYQTNFWDLNPWCLIFSGQIFEIWRKSLMEYADKFCCVRIRPHWYPDKFLTNRVYSQWLHCSIIFVASIAADSTWISNLFWHIFFNSFLWLTILLQKNGGHHWAQWWQSSFIHARMRGNQKVKESEAEDVE